MKISSSPTLRLLNSSTIIGFSGGLRLHIAFLLAGINPLLSVYFAGGLIIYATYTLDRSFDAEEDAINRQDILGARKSIAIGVCLCTYLLGVYLLMREGIYFAPLIPLLTGYLYSKGITIGGFHLKLKGGVGLKNLVIGLTWGGTIAFIVSAWVGNIFIPLVIFFFFCSKLFMNSVIFDFKDVPGDQAAGIRTLPVYLGEILTKKVLAMLCISLHSAMFFLVISGYIRRELIILGYSFISGMAAILLCSIVVSPHLEMRERLREIIIDGESTIAIVLRTLSHM